ncbi:hypothetical protein OIDMADRAFT_44010 [Oidiodendron maius Zn]|uniref:Uncharacterized protein n=1 Tax=Oidiodendron maius (strain Zn) TaxID=913774 RepID=A0A0C3CGT7_OIDMZ|nr:hypothetical protein OIDMADRAFT_44010 [Oidiodendron maius Zn]
MSQEYSSSNPFRRKGTPATATSPPLDLIPVVDSRVDEQTDAADSQSVDAPKKLAKKVRVQSPHPPSPSSLDTPSTIVGGDDSTYDRAPTPSQQDDDPFENALSDTSSEENDNKSLPAPPNPFAKTLETMEPSKRDTTTAKSSAAHTGRPSLDVEAFKRLLMTGNLGPGISTRPNAPQPHLHHALGDGGSSTDASSLSRNSIFEPVHDQHLDSPSTPHDISEAEDDRRGLDTMPSTDGRKKPLPPSSRHGKLIKVELRDDPTNSPTIPISSPLSSSRRSTGPAQARVSPSSSLVPSPSDLNKPLPPAPARTSHDSDRQSIFDLESAGKIPEPPSPPQSIRRKTPPPPPLTRRHSQRVPEPRTTRADVERLSSSVIEETRDQGTPGIYSTDTATGGASPRPDNTRAPPPPPSRRPASIRGLVNLSSSASSSSLPMSLPTSIPARGSSLREKPQSVVMDVGTNKRASLFPPPPPPPRNSDTSRRTSGENSRKSWDSTRKGSEASSILEEKYEKRPDIMADLTKLQQEIDALRAKGKKSVS